VSRIPACPPGPGEARAQPLRSVEVFEIQNRIVVTGQDISLIISTPSGQLPDSWLRWAADLSPAQLANRVVAGGQSERLGLTWSMERAEAAAETFAEGCEDEDHAEALRDALREWMGGSMCEWQVHLAEHLQAHDVDLDYVHTHSDAGLIPSREVYRAKAILERLVEVAALREAANHAQAAEPGQFRSDGSPRYMGGSDPWQP
jgi:hypothetical protein